MTQGCCYNNQYVILHRIFPTLLLFCHAPFACAGDWPQFRGPEGMGVSSDKGLPVEVGPDKNVIWKTALPPGHSSPIVIGDRIFLTAVADERLMTLAIDRRTGAVG